MSATIEDIREYIERKDDEARFQRTQIYKLFSEYTHSQELSQGRVWEYTLERCYDYLNVKIITTRDRIIDLACGSNEKWLIFVDSILFGKELEKRIKMKFQELYGQRKEIGKDYEKDVVFLSSGYKRAGGDAAEEVQIIKSDSMQSARVLIVTSVMDNGISLKDDRLNNVVVFADNETEFLQMLGRKRENGKPVNLYIFKWEKEHFERRRDQLSRKEEVASDYMRHLNEVNLILIDPCGQGIDWKASNNNERLFVARQHAWLLKRLLDEENVYNKVKVAFYASNGWLLLNFLSVAQIDKLKVFYNDVIENFSSEGEDAFVKEQLRWLGKGEEEIEDMIAQSRVTEEARLREEVCGMINDIIDDQMTKMEAIDFKNRIKDKLLSLVRFCQDSNEKNIVEKSLKKNDRPISDKNMEFLRKNCNLPYKVETFTEGESKYVFRYTES